MGSAFHLSAQHKAMDSKIVAALERLSQVFRVLLWEEAKEHRLSPIQIQFLVYILHHPVGLCRVSQLAKEFGLTQATVSDAISSLEAKGLIFREPFSKDGRIASLRLTSSGQALAEKISSWADVIQENIASFAPDEQETVMRFLMQLIESLQKAGVIAIARMCITCRFFGRDAHPGSSFPHHCHLLDKPLANPDLRIDCPEHQPAA